MTNPAPKEPMTDEDRRRVDHEATLPWWTILTIENPDTATERLISRCYRAFARASQGEEAELRILNRARDEGLAHIRRRPRP